MLINLKQYGLIYVEGVDAEKFLQGQLTCDVTKLAIGQSTLTAHCDPKGKVNSLFRLIRHAEQQFYLLIRQDLLNHGLAQLKKYAVFSQVTFSEKNWTIVGMLDQDLKECGAISPQIRIDLGNRQILCWEQKMSLEYTQDTQYWDYLDMQQGFPILTIIGQGEFIPQALNLQEIEQAISFQKGCYIGQETIARAKYRGINKRAMYLLQAKTAALVEIGTEIEMQLEHAWRKTGCILSAVNLNGILYLQVVMSNQLEENQRFRLPVDESELKIIPLKYN
ncbi:folate-binding protein YgfZ [Histophilus somni]|uniref:Folate-binding protein n=1 Tax=Histophilus somni TaxID=731 RepID=A0AAX2S3D6_HISSO|nr:folate-binding protein YgfZ [Histophilus somni]QEH09233.1 folate-binding protein YgfZ [Histophilus somni]QEH12111.1 folate-binding protein YgfZ [Histophilus somni]QEH25509.1 folate-binding protein YgfZ [Histophilus somni]QEH26587.1 folate-binding protein YgfZ [Histophilus somni]QEH50782.1 folate-binding protein YgfZ [Histophilus somni]